MLFRSGRFFASSLLKLSESIANKGVHLLLDYFLVQLFNPFGHGLLSLFRMVSRNFILSGICNTCLFLSFFRCAHFIVFYLLYFSSFVVPIKVALPRLPRAVL